MDKIRVYKLEDLEKEKLDLEERISILSAQISMKTVKVIEEK